MEVKRKIVVSDYLALHVARLLIKLHTGQGLKIEGHFNWATVQQVTF